MAFGEVVPANVQSTSEFRGRGPTTYRVSATSANSEQWPLSDAVSGKTAEILDQQLSRSDGSTRPEQVPFIVVRFWPAIHNIGVRPAAEPALAGLAVIGLLLLLITYGLTAPELAPSHGMFRRILSSASLAAFVGAAQDQVFIVPAIAAAASFIGPRVRGEPVTVIDVVIVVPVLAVCFYVLLYKRIIRPSTRVLETRRWGIVRIEVPSSSVFNFIFEAGWIGIGVWFLWPPRSEVALTFGLALVMVPGLLAVARALGWRQRHRVD
jgi:hypothetical protein